MADAEQMSAEFGTVAEWSTEAAQALGPEHYLPAACRGSGGPAAMDWLIERLPVAGAARLLDVGAGCGGPAAFARARSGVSAILIEPEMQACRATRRLFGLATVQASATDLPVASASVSAAWCLGVLSTVEDHLGVLAELRRVLEPGGRLGMLVYAATRHLDRVPTGNCFPMLHDLPGMYSAAGLDILDDARLRDLPAPPQQWTDRQHAVDAWIGSRYGDRPQWQQSLTQESTFAELLDTDAVVGQLSLVSRTPT